jgi:hypothetical protein
MKFNFKKIQETWYFELYHPFNFLGLICCWTLSHISHLSFGKSSILLPLKIILKLNFIISTYIDKMGNKC